MTTARGRAAGRELALLIALAILANGLGQGLSRFSYALLLPDMRDAVIHSYGLAGLLGTINLVAYLVGLVVVSALSGRVSAVRIVWVGLGLCAVAAGVLAAAPDYAALALGMVLSGGGAAGTWVPLAGVVSASVDPARRGAAVGAITTGFGGAILLSAQLRSAVYAVTGGDSWRLVWLIEAVLIAAASAACAAWLRPPAEATVAYVGRPSSILRSVPGWGRLTLAYVAVGLGYMTYASFLTALLEKEAHFSAGHTEIAFSVIGVFSLFGSVAVGRLADRVGWRGTYAVSALVMAACALLLLARSEPWTTVSVALYGLSLTSTGALVVGYLSDHLRGTAVSAAFAAITLPFGVAQAVAPWIGGWLRDASGSFTDTFALAAATLFLAAVSAATLPRVRSTFEPAVGEAVEASSA